jgi:polyhydroxyalkanoate synthesis regulator phasin
MVAKKQTTGGGVSTSASARKPWKKKTPVEIVLEQGEKLRADIAEKEDEIKELRKQLHKFEEARKLFEG